MKDKIAQNIRIIFCTVTILLSLLSYTTGIKWKPILLKKGKVQMKWKMSQSWILSLHIQNCVLNTYSLKFLRKLFPLVDIYKWVYLKNIYYKIFRIIQYFLWTTNCSALFFLIEIYSTFLFHFFGNKVCFSELNSLKRITNCHRLFGWIEYILY